MCAKECGIIPTSDNIYMGQKAGAAEHVLKYLKRQNI